MKKIYLVTGATGHLGTTICEALIERGDDVRAFVMPNDNLVNHLANNIILYYGNVLDIDSLEAAFKINDDEELLVIHCAGIVSIASRKNNKVIDVNVNGTKNVVDLCKKHNVKKLIYVSSVHAIPVGKGKETLKEITDFDPTKVVGLYAKTKAEATAYVLKNAKEGYPFCVVHPSGIIGPNDYGHGHLTQLLVDYCNGSLTACVKGGYDFVDVRDVTSGILNCLDNGEDGECYILSGHYCSIKQVLDYLHEITGRKQIKTILPKWFVKMVAPLAEAYYRMRKQPPLFTAYSIYTLTANADFSNELAKNKLNYNPRPLKETLNDTVNWLKQQKRIN